MTPATATAMLQRLAELSLVDYQPYKGVSLTPSGERVALEVIRHHRLIEAYLAEALGMPEDRVHEEAEVLEHYISEELEALIAAKLGEPSHDPHGSAIPGPDLLPPGREPRAGEAAAARRSRARRSKTSSPARPRSPTPPAARSRATRRGIGRIWPFLGPAFIAAVAYIDPGNFATNIAGGAKFGYLLLWVVLAANLVAMLVQTQSAKLGIATGKNLAELCRERFSRRTSIGLWLQAELVAMATDIAEVVGAALGLNLLFGIPLFPAGLIAGAGAFAILALQQMGFRRLEAGITALVGVVVASFVYELFDAQPQRRRSRQAPRRPRLRRHREHPAGDRDHRRDGDAARRLPALGADPAADRRPRRRREEADPRLREGRRRDRPLDRRRWSTSR